MDQLVKRNSDLAEKIGIDRVKSIVGAGGGFGPVRICLFPFPSLNTNLAWLPLTFLFVHVYVHIALHFFTNRRRLYTTKLDIIRMKGGKKVWWLVVVSVLWVSRWNDSLLHGCLLERYIEEWNDIFFLIGRSGWLWCELYHCIRRSYFLSYFLEQIVAWNSKNCSASFDSFCLTSANHFQDSKRFGRQIRQAMLDMKDLFDRQFAAGAVKTDTKLPSVTPSTDSPA